MTTSKTRASIILRMIFYCVVVFASSIVENICHASENEDADQLGAELVWTMVNVNIHSQGDAHVVQTRGGKTILIDCGDDNHATSQLVPFLMEKKIDAIDMVFITHAHFDHYEGLEALINEGIEIEAVYFNIPEESACDREPLGCNSQDLISITQFLEDNHIPVYSAEAGMRFRLGNSTVLNILYAYDGRNTPVGWTDLNDTSLIMMLEHSGYRFLFTGDLNAKLGEYLAYSGSDLRADVIKVPHHGTEGCAPNEFFEAVSPSYALVPSPRELWLSEGSDRIRNWFESQNIPVYVNGIHGSITVSIQYGHLKIEAEYENGEDISNKSYSMDEENKDDGGGGGGCFITGTRY